MIVRGCRPCRSPAMRPSLMPMSAFTIPSTASTISDVRDHEVERAVGRGDRAVACRGRRAASCRRRTRTRRPARAGPARPPPTGRCRRAGRGRRASGPNSSAYSRARHPRPTSRALVRERTRRSPARFERAALPHRRGRPLGEPVQAVHRARCRRARPGRPRARRRARTAPPCRPAMSRCIPKARAAVEAQRGVDLEEVEVRADLHRAVAACCDRRRVSRLAARVQLDLALGGARPRRARRPPPARAPGRIGSMDRDELLAVLEHRLDLQRRRSASATPGSTSSVVRMPAPSSISSATLRPSRAPSQISSAIRARASG